MSKNTPETVKRTWRREPLLHFALLGALLFAGHAIWSTQAKSAEQTIEVTPQITARLAAVFEAEQSRPPKPEEAHALITSYVTEQALSREAMRAGLDSGDTIITRRLAQKMRFMLEDTAAPKDPGDAVLQPWYQERPDNYAVPAARAISHIYISPNGKTDLTAAIMSAQQAVSAAPDQWKSIGDPFMMQRQFGLIDDVAMRRVFGSDFTRDVFALPDNQEQWSAPIESAFGIHLVRLDNVRRASPMAFDAVRSQVLADWQETTLRQRNAARVKAAVERYRVTGQ